MSDEFLVRKATPLEAAQSAMKVILNEQPTEKDVRITAAYTTALVNVVEHLTQLETDIKGTPMIADNSSLLKPCPIPGCGAPPEEIEGKVRCSNTKCEFSELVTKVLWQAIGRAREPEELREAVADVQHQIWAHWMKYFFSCCHTDPITGLLSLPADKESRWKLQMETLYVQLSEKEKDSDREQADKVLNVLQDINKGVLYMYYEALAEVDRLGAQISAVDNVLAEGESDAENERPLPRSERIRSIKARRKELFDENERLYKKLGEEGPSG